MDKLAGLKSNIELLIRYLLSGVTICAIYLLSLADPLVHIKWIPNEPALAAFVAAAVGFVAYSIYRIVFWIIGDGVAWLLGLSAPALDKGTSILYHKPYSNFLLWRRSKDLDEALNGYLHYRWAVVHFAFVISIALIFAVISSEPKSIINNQFYFTIAAGSIGFVIALWQASFLFRVERELYRKTRK